ncbi:MAG: hypothetical protein ACTS7D_01255 [Candidatus Hodgkinia cicadicola]
MLRPSAASRNINFVQWPPKEHERRPFDWTKFNVLRSRRTVMRRERAQWEAKLTYDSAEMKCGIMPTWKLEIWMEELCFRRTSFVPDEHFANIAKLELVNTWKLTSLVLRGHERLVKLNLASAQWAGSF